MSAPLRPRALPPGSTIGVCAPSGPVADAALLQQRIRWLESEGYTVRRAPHLLERRGYLAGDDAQRAGDLLALLDDPEVDGLIVARGGYGSARILRDLDPVRIGAARKLVIGYSDATSLLLYLWRCARLASIHGPMLERADPAPDALRRLLALMRGEPEGQEPLRGASLRPGRARGVLVGGNLKVVTSTLGTPWEIDTRDAVLFLEEIGEQPYALDRSLVQLRESGKLAQAAGVAVGCLVGCESERYPEISARDAICEILAGCVDGPVVCDLPFGHVADHRALGIGVAAEIDGDAATLRMLEPVVDVKLGGGA